MNQRLLALALGLASLTIACGSGEHPAVVYVDGAAVAGGDGTAERPFQTVREALEVDWTIEMVVIAGGDHPAPVTWSFAAPLIVQGTPHRTTRLTAEDGTARLVWQAADTLVLRNLALGAPLDLSGGGLELQEVGLGGVAGPALGLDQVATRLFDVTLSEVVEVTGQPGTGDGIVVTGGWFDWSDGTGSAPDRALVLGGGVVATLADLNLSGGDRAPLTVHDQAWVDADRLIVQDTGIAVYVQASTLSLDDSTIRRAGTAGLMVSADAEVTVTGTHFTDCPQGHISVLGAGASLTLAESNLQNAAAAGCVFVAQATGDISITDNFIYTCAGGGINLSTLTGAVVEDNTIMNILPDPIFPEIADGIGLIDAQASIRGNTILEAAGAGITLIRSTAEIADNQIGPVGSVAISIIEPGAARTTVSGNLIGSAVGGGVLVLGANVDISNNTLSGVAYSPADGFGDGVAFGQGADVVATGNSSDGNARNGFVFLDGATGSISGNTATGNGQYGILEFCSGAANDVDVGVNTLTGNTLGEQSLCSTLGPR